MTSSATTLSSVLDELDRAIAEHMQANVGSVEIESSVQELRGLLQGHFNRQGDCNLDEVQVDFSRVSLPSWVPRALTDFVGATGTVTASSALASALKNPMQHNNQSLVSSIEMAAAASQHSGSRANSRPVSEHAGPSGLTTADRNGNHDRPSGPSSTTTLQPDNVSQMNSKVSPTNATQHFQIGTTASRGASCSSRAVERARLECELARAKEERIAAEIAALDAGSSRASEAGSLQDRLSLAGLSRGAVPQAQAAHGVAHSPEPPDSHLEDVSESIHNNARHDQPAASQPPQSS